MVMKTWSSRIEVDHVMDKFTERLCATEASARVKRRGGTGDEALSRCTLYSSGGARAACPLLPEV